MNKSYIRNIPGTLIIALGIGFLLDALDIIDFSSFTVDWWPTLLIIVGGLSFFSNPKAPTWPLAIVAIGVLFQLNALDILNFNVWNLVWPTILIMVGISLLPQRSSNSERVISDNTVDASATFSGVEVKNVSSNFEGGRATALFGGTSLDLRDAKMNKSANLEVFIAFGGVEIKIPEDWKVVVNSMPIFGGVENRAVNPTNKNTAPTLYVKGTCLFGGIEIRN